MMVLSRLGLTAANGAYQKVRRRIVRLELDTSHFVQTWNGSPKRRSRWSDEQLASAVKTAKSYAQTIQALGLIPAGGNYDRVQRRISALGLDTTHFTGQRWNLGGAFHPTPAQPVSQILVLGRSIKSHHLKKRLIREGRKKAECEDCGWAARTPDGVVPVELDHINGDKMDNRIENLRILCPNCHALTPTYRGRNIGRRS